MQVHTSGRGTSEKLSLAKVVILAQSLDLMHLSRDYIRSVRRNHEKVRHSDNRFPVTLGLQQPVLNNSLGTNHRADTPLPRTNTHASTPQSENDESDGTGTKNKDERRVWFGDDNLPDKAVLNAVDKAHPTNSPLLLMSLADCELSEGEPLGKKSGKVVEVKRRTGVVSNIKPFASE